MKKYINYLLKWLQEELDYRNAETFVFGVSGGIDSAVIAYLLAQLYQTKSLGIMMPCKSNPQDIVDAKLVMDGCGIPYHIVDLTQTHTILMESIGDHYSSVEDDIKNRIIVGNTSARLRMTTLYTIAQTCNAIVVGTDNAVEWYTGYFTKFGDGGVDITPLFHLNKADVYEMAALLGVPESIIRKHPSAGLWQDQTDEEEIGTTYEMLNKYLSGGIVPPKDLDVIQYWHERSHHKRALPRIPDKYL